DEIPHSESSFQRLAQLSGHVPLVGINAGRCFAGNAAVLGMCDVTIVTRDSNLGMAGAAMIEGGGLGVVQTAAIGPAEEQRANCVIDLLVDDEHEAARAARRYVSYFQGAAPAPAEQDNRRLRHLIPAERVRGYDMRAVMGLLADADSVLEVRGGYGKAMITA